MTAMMTMMTMTTTTTTNGGDDMPTSAINEAFYRAAMNDNTILMNKLLNRGADVNYVDKTTGYTALLAATKSKLVRAAQFLLEKGADPAAHDSSGYVPYVRTCTYEFNFYHKLFSGSKRSFGA